VVRYSQDGNGDSCLSKGQSLRRIPSSGASKALGALAAPYGFRVPFLVVSAYTGTYDPGKKTYTGYVSGACASRGNCQNNTAPYQHEFGSVLAFIEWNFLGQAAIGQIDPPFPFADYYAPEWQAPKRTLPLLDFFPLYPTPRPFVAINPPAGPWQNFDFVHYNGPFDDPDNDAIDH
jgi:hypothetical protein